MNVKGIIRTSTKYVFYILTVVQVTLGLLWVIRNFGHVYMWPETAEYLDIAGNYKLDEYVGIIYPLMVKYMYSTPLYIVQLIMAFGSSLLFLHKGIKLDGINALWGSAYLISFPSLLQFHLSIRPESLRLSAVLFVITFLIYKKRSVLRYLAVALALIILMVATKANQEVGARGRIQRTFWSMAFQRTCTEYYSQSYAAWDERTQDTYTIWETLEIIKKTDNVVYEIGPTMDSKWGLEAANDSYKYMTLKCIEIRTRDVCEMVGSDLIQSAILPFGFINERDGVVRSQTGRNYEAFMSNRGPTDSFYWFYSVWGLIVIMALGIVNIIIDFRRFRLSNPAWELLIAAVLQWLYKTLTTGDAIDYAKYLVVIAFWCVLGVHLSLGSNCKETADVVK